MSTLLFNSALLIFCYATCWFLIAVFKKRNDVADIAWGLGYILITTYLYGSTNHSSIANFIYCLVALWGIRLSLHIFLRNRNKGEDYRYKQWREEVNDELIVYWKGRILCTDRKESKYLL